MRAPTNTKEVRSFLGLLNYYGKFVPKLHQLKAPFEALLKKDVPFVWTMKMKKTFENIKSILTGPLLLAHYDPRQILIVAADASSIGIGGVLLQRAPDGQEKAVFHMSKALTKAQQKYSQIEKEALALVTAVERFRKFVYGRHFVLQTDHRPLLALFKTSNTKGLDTRTANRLKRWALRLIGYDFEIEYVNTEKFGQADALSRLIQEAHQDATDADLEEVVAILQEADTELQQIVNESVQFLPSAARQELQRATFNDEILAKVIHRLQSGWLKSDITDKDLIPYYRRREYLAMVDDTLILNEKLVIPKHLQPTALKQLHIAHPGIRRMTQLARRYFYWPTMHDDIEKYVKGCNHCDRTASSPRKEPLHPWPDPKKPWSRLHIDFAGPIHGQWILVVVDSYSKFLDAGWFSTITSAATCQYLRRLFSRYGPPEVLVSDNGTQFTSVEFAKLCVEFNILHLRTPPGHPQSNGQAERMVRTLKSSIDTSSASQLETELNNFVYAYNYTPSDAVPDHKSPAEIFLGRRLRTPLDIFTPIAKPSLLLTPRQKVMKQQFDTHHGAKPRSFVSGQAVLIQLSNGQRIPGKIVKLVGKAIARVSIEGGYINRHFNQIWNRSNGSKRKSTSLSEDLLPSGQNSAPILPFPVPNTPQMEARMSEPSNEKLAETPELAARRSERLSHRSRLDYKVMGGTRSYRKQHS